MRLKITGMMILGCLLSMSAGATQPWYNAELVATGSPLFQQHCAECHGANAEGTREWKKTDASGHYPPPPLNGSAHAWHHSIPQLARSIKQGGQQLGRLARVHPGLLTTRSGGLSGYTNVILGNWNEAGVLCLER